MRSLEELPHLSSAWNLIIIANTCFFFFLILSFLTFNRHPCHGLWTRISITVVIRTVRQDSKFLKSNVTFESNIGKRKKTFSLKSFFCYSQISKNLEKSWLTFVPELLVVDFNIDFLLRNDYSKKIKPFTVFRSTYIKRAYSRACTSTKGSTKGSMKVY